MHPKIFWPALGILILLTVLIAMGWIPDFISPLLSNSHGDKTCTVTKIFPYHEECRPKTGPIGGPITKF